MTAPFDVLLERLEAQGCSPKPNGTGYQARCPVPGHGKGRGDRQPSLSITPRPNGDPSFTCHVECDGHSILDALGLEWREVRSSDGWEPPAKPASNSKFEEDEVRRYADQLTPEVASRLNDLRGWDARALQRLGVGIDGDNLTIPVRNAEGALVGISRYQPNPARRNGRPKMVAAAGSKRDLFPPPETQPPKAELWITEGEPCAITAQSLGLAGVGVPGVQSWHPEYAPRFANRDVVLLPDCDPQGRDLMERIAADLVGVARSVRVVELDAGRDDGYDIGDWAGDATTAQDRITALSGLRDLVDRAQPRTEIDSTPTGDARVQSIAPLSFVSIGDVTRDAPAKPEWLWDGYLAPGCIALLAGKPKAGKSTLMFALLRALRDGEPFLDRETRQTTTVLLSEERETTLAEKARAWSLSTGVDCLLRYRAAGTEWPEIVTQAANHARRCGHGLLVVDVWDKWAGLVGEQENTSGPVLAALNPLEEVAASGLAVLIVAHHRKAGGSHGEAVRGTNALTGAVDLVIDLERAPHDVEPRARILQASSRFQGTPEELVAIRTDDGYDAVDTLDGLRAGRERDELLALLGDADKPLTAEELKDALGLPASTVRKRLKECPEVDQTGSGKRGDALHFFLSTRAYLLDVESIEEDGGAAELLSLEEVR